MENSQNHKKVSVIIPCLNEERFIAGCLDSLLNQTYSNKNLEILIVDGMSKDKTREIVKKYTNKYNFIKLLDNPDKITPKALNIGIKKANGNIIIRMDAHTKYKEDYIEKCVHYLKKTKTDNVGGIWIIRPSNNNIISQAISYILQSPLGTGNAHYKTTKSKKPQEVDTVPFGCYKKEIFNKIGLFNEKLVRNQDIELNSRLRKNGGKILLIPEIKCYYYAPGNIKDFIKKNFSNGKWNIYTQKIIPNSLKLRHFIPFSFVMGIITSIILSFFTILGTILLSIILGSYLLVNIIFSFKITLKKKNLKLFPILIFLFFVLHFSYGIGSLWGILTMWKIEK